MPDAASPHVAVFPGSFDPLTAGHVELGRRAARLFDRVVVAVAVDAGKQHLLSLEERVAIATDAFAQVPNIAVASFSGLVVDCARLHGATALVKGLRNGGDLEREAQMDRMNRSLAPAVDTVYLISAPELCHVSSSLVKHVLGLGGDVSAYLTPLALRLLGERLREQGPA
jgi:pantetheine-phosphate adenylyltransferase